MIEVEVQLLKAGSSLKDVLKDFGFSGQKIKKYFSAKELNAPVRNQQILKLPIDLANNLEINPEYVGSDCYTLFENDDYLAIHKPANIHSHPQRYTDTNTVLNYLASIQKYTPLMINKLNYDRGLLHRLDFETSGVLILSKKENLLNQFREQFNDLMKAKVYLAIVEGDFNKEGTWKQYFKPFGEKGSKQVLTNDMTAQYAESEIYKIQNIDNNKSLVLVKLKSGIRHQIRAQLSSLGFPILGDTLYGGQESQRLFLHSWIYEWENFRVEDKYLDLFGHFLNLDSALKMSLDKLSIIKSR